VRLDWLWLDCGRSIGVSVSPPRRLRDGSTELRAPARYNLPPSLVQIPLPERDALIRGVLHAANIALALRDERE